MKRVTISPVTFLVAPMTTVAATGALIPQFSAQTIGSSYISTAQGRRRDRARFR
jgi:hypothetical protein